MPYDRRNWWSHLFLVRESVLPLILPKIAFFSTLSIFVTYGISRHWLPTLPVAYFTVIGIALGLMMGFRMNSAYDRYWEGRKAWGGMVNRTRNFIRQLAQHVSPESAREAAALIAVFAHGGKRQLWKSAEQPELVRLVGEEKAAWFLKSPAVAQNALTALSRLLMRERALDNIGPVDHERLEADLAQLIDQLGVCERIQSTPIPLTFVIYLRRLLLGYCCTIPLALYDSMQWLVPLVTAIVSYIFIGLDRSAVEIEDPFEPTVFSLNLEAISKKIEADAFANAERGTESRA